MTRTTPEMLPPSPNFHATPAGGRLTTTYDLTCNRPTHGGSSVESGFEPGTLRPQSWDLTTRPPRPRQLRVASLYGSKRPLYPGYMYLIAPTSLLFLNPLGFILMEAQKNKDAIDSASKESVGGTIFKTIGNVSW
ncbi:hypothetical protein AVEN_73269-1, partial [Araneus ventricosus]